MNDILMIILILGTAGVSAGLLCYALAIRLYKFIFPGTARRNFMTSRNQLKPLLRPFAEFFRSHRSEFVRKKTAEYRQQIMTAGGFWNGLNAFEVLSAQFTFSIIGAGAFLLLGIAAELHPVLTMGCMLSIGAGGYLYPGIALKGHADKRRLWFLRQLPSALDILRLGADAGLDFHSSVDYLVQIYLPGPVREELTVYRRDTALGKTSTEALTEIAERMNDPEVTSIFISLAQALEMGTSMSDICLATVTDLRKKRTFKAEEDAQRAAINISFPLLLLILPGIFIVLLGPVIKSLLTTLLTIS
ncbi:type II secretion system F family protein [Lentisphaerota bacterium ZTH]|nr:type II secretion system F family protein [Lentisphaerota bacterium]WET05773.1 type II secretion system F family protein [Lentisphaerota bacterium ZTH]